MKFLLLFLLITFPSLVLAEKWVINPDHSECLFSVSYLKVSEVTGKFSEFKGEIEFNEGTTIPKSLWVDILVSSIHTGQRMRDGHLRSSEFLKAQTHPVARFESDVISLVRGQTYSVKGRLTLAGVTAPHNLEISVGEKIKDTWSYQNIFVRFKGQINRKDFKMQWNKTIAGQDYLVGDVVTLWGSVQIQPINSVTPTSKHMIPDTPSIREREQFLRGEKQRPNVIPPTGIPSHVANTPPTAPIQVIKETRVLAIEHSLWWHVALWSLGMMGFIASIIIGLYGKKLILDTIKGDQGETSLLNMSADAICIVFVLLYAMAFWMVGWGN